MIKILSDNPLPKSAIPAGNTIYPFGQMAVSQSFSLEGLNVTRVREAAKKFSQRHGVKFFIGHDEDGAMFCWRTR